MCIGLQGDLVVLAVEPLCICGIDVAAPPQTRAKRHSMNDLTNIFQKQLTFQEVGRLNLSCMML